ARCLAGCVAIPHRCLQVPMQAAGIILCMQTKSPPNIMSAPDLLQARSRFGLLLGSVYRQWRRQVDLSFKDLGLSDASHMPLLVLYVHEEALRQKDLADALHLDTSSLVRVLAQLRKAPLVEWTSDPRDRRTKCIVLTTAGRERAASILAKRMGIERDSLADLAASA